MSKSLAERVKDEPAAAGEPSDRARASGREQRGERQQGKKAAKAARVALAVEKQAAAAADEQAATAASKELPPRGAFADLVLSLVATPNPQHDVHNKPGEKHILDKVCRWLKARDIPYTSDLSWGVHAVLTGPGGAGSQPGILLSGHLDSDHLDIKDLKNLRVEGDQLVCPGQVGSGVAK